MFPCFAVFETRVLAVLGSLLGPPMSNSPRYKETGHTAHHFEKVVGLEGGDKDFDDALLPDIYRGRG